MTEPKEGRGDSAPLLPDVFGERVELDGDNHVDVLLPYDDGDEDVAVDLNPEPPE